MAYVIDALRMCILILAVLLWTGAADNAAAQTMIKRGNAAMTGFSGAKPEANVPDDVDPLDRKFIALDLPIGENCSAGQRYNPQTGSCEERSVSCPVGTHWSRSRYACLPNDGGATCPNGSPRLTSGGCRCPLNKRWSQATKSCEGSRTLPGNCLPGERHINGSCVRTGIEDIPVNCPPGQSRIGKSCVPVRVVPPKVVEPYCGPGRTRSGGACIRLPAPGGVVIPFRPKVTPGRPNFSVKPDRPRIDVQTNPPVRITPTTPKITPKASINLAPNFKAPINKAPVNRAPINMPKVNLR